MRATEEYAIETPCHVTRPSPGRASLCRREGAKMEKKTKERWARNVGANRGLCGGSRRSTVLYCNGLSGARAPAVHASERRSQTRGAVRQEDHRATD